MIKTEDRKRKYDTYLELIKDEERQRSFESLTQLLKKTDDLAHDQVKANLEQYNLNRDTTLCIEVVRKSLGFVDSHCVRCSGSREERILLLVACKHKYHWSCFSERAGEVKFRILGSSFTSCHQEYCSKDLAEELAEQYKHVIQHQNLDDGQEVRAALTLNPGICTSASMVRLEQAAYLAYKETILYLSRSIRSMMSRTSIERQEYLGKTNKKAGEEDTSSGKSREFAPWLKRATREDAIADVPTIVSKTNHYNDEEARKSPEKQLAVVQKWKGVIEARLRKTEILQMVQELKNFQTKKDSQTIARHSRTR